MTDEHTGQFHDWALEEIEFVTDAISVEVLYERVRAADHPQTAAGFVYGLAYILNQLRKQRPDLEEGDIGEMVRAMKEHAQSILEKAKTKLLGTLARPTVQLGL